MRCGKNLDDSERLEKLSAYMDGKMEPDERGDWEEHLTQCGTCRTDLDWMGRTAELLRGQMEEVPESFSRGWRDAVRQEAAAPGELAGRRPEGISFLWRGIDVRARRTAPSGPSCDGSVPLRP